jgi:endonuclease/exonuclease/phosphatase family metal-dependent hydrolase
VVLSLLACHTALAADIVVASWNMKRLGHGDQQSFGALAAIAAKADLVAAQEVMNARGLERLEKALEQHTGESWSTLASHLIGSKGYKEMYAFLWRDSTVEYVDGAVVYMDREDQFIREPFSARFASRKDGKPFAVASVHILYGKGVSDRTPEIRALADYWVWMGDIYPQTPRMLVGDFNLRPSDPAWATLKQHAKPLITRGATTLSSVNGRYANLYDNIWVEPDTRLPISAAGIADFPRMLGWDHEKSPPASPTSPGCLAGTTRRAASMSPTTLRSSWCWATPDSTSLPSKPKIRVRRRQSLPLRRSPPAMSRLRSRWEVQCVAIATPKSFTGRAAPATT